MSVPPKEKKKQPTFQNQTVGPGQIESCLNFKENLTDYIYKAQAIGDGINCFYSRRQIEFID